MIKKIFIFVFVISTLNLAGQESAVRWLHLLKDGATAEKYRVMEDFDSIIFYNPAGVAQTQTDKQLVNSSDGKQIYLMKDNVVFKQYGLSSEIDSIAVLYANQFIDMRDGNKYKTIQIGKQVWMAENLKYIPSVTGISSTSLSTACYYVYGYNGTDIATAKQTQNYQTYGVLYNWTAAMANEASSDNNPSNVQGVCPNGWHLPSHSEWYELRDYLMDNGYSYDGIKSQNRVAISLAAPYGWRSDDGVGTVGNSENYPHLANKTGFTAIPGGAAQFSGNYHSINEGSYWWSSTQYSNDGAYSRYIRYNTVGLDASGVRKDNGFSVRCIQD